MLFLLQPSGRARSKLKVAAIPIERIVSLSWAGRARNYEPRRSGVEERVPREDTVGLFRCLPSKGGLGGVDAPAKGRHCPGVKTSGYVTVTTPPWGWGNDRFWKPRTTQPTTA